jgi:hypothetical protein
MLCPGHFFSVLILCTICRTPWKGDEPVARPLPTHRTAQTQNKRTQTSMLPVGFEPTTPVFGRAKTIHASDRTATVIGKVWLWFPANKLLGWQHLTWWMTWRWLFCYLNHPAIPTNHISFVNIILCPSFAWYFQHIINLMPHERQ